MAELYDEDGNAVAAFTPEEVEAAKAEVAAQFESKIQEKELALAKELEKEKNFNALRGQKDEIEEEKKSDEVDLKTTISELEAKIEAAKSEGVGLVTSSLRDSIIDDLAGDDVDLRATIRENYNIINRPENTRDEIAQRVKDAYLLSINIEEGVGGSPTAAPSGPGRSIGSGGVQVSEDLAEIGRKFGLSDADWQKYYKN